jgi:4-hydroxy-2-oxoglutarate aldolase
MEGEMDQARLFETLKGALPAIVTPMTPGGDLDHVGLAENLRWMNRLGLMGYLLLGSTGEMVHLSEFERALVLEVGRREVPESLVMIAGTGLAGTRVTIEETRRAAKAGADVALVVTPSYYQKGMTAPSLTAHYQAVADASPIPIMLYSVPGVTGITMPPEVVRALAPHPNVIGMKNSGTDPVGATAYREAAGEHPFIILAGSPDAAPGFLLTGIVDGVIFAAANVVPEASVALVEAAQAGNIQAVREQSALFRRVAASVGRFGIAGWKAGIEARGYNGGPVRLPLRNLSPEEREQVKAEVATLTEENTSLVK